MSNKIVNTFTDDEMEALRRMASDQKRPTKMQLEYLVIQALREAGYLPKQTTIKQTLDHA